MEEYKLTEEQKKSCYESYLEDMLYEWGTTKYAVTYEEYCKECEEYGWDLI